MTLASLVFNAESVAAQAEIDRRKADAELTPERLYWLWRDATGNAEEAERLEAELAFRKHP